MSGLGLAVLLAATAPSERSLLSEIERLDRALAAAELELSETTTELVSLQKQIAHIEAEVASTTLRRDEAHAQFQRRLRALARMPAGARLVVLGGSRSLADYLETTRVLRWVTSHDRMLHQQLVTHAQRLQGLAQTLAARRLHVVDLETRERAARDAIAERRNERLALATSILTDRDRFTRLSAERTRASRELLDMVRRLSPATPTAARFSQNRRRLPWPAVGEVDVDFGQQVERAWGTATTHNGIDIRAAAGSAVQAVAAGKIAFAGWLEGYGRLVIIDHGDQSHTLYAHLGSLDVAVGDSVMPGARIGTVGDTGSLRGTVLYFEVRQRGRPVDPRDWLRR